ncbi:serine/threonine-protein kinase [Nonomuraea endophytica]|uniref:serine/threonine-protein kinase n=1 Tax=Nonomuraea endophytica TaxID=714136 RepID=UPI0037CB6BB0
MYGHWGVPGYTEVRELGAGASGRVVLATRDHDGEQVAIKYLSDELRADVTFVARFRHEARLLGTMRSPYNARLIDYVETGEGAAIIMDLVNGVSLREVLSSEGPTGPEAALTVLKGSLLGLSEAHAVGVVHRDFKPENVIVQGDGTSKLVDFGIAVRAGQGANTSGTPPYMAPEQWSGAPASPTTDVYAATIVFFECLTGARPYRATNLAALARQHHSTPPPVEEVPETLRGLVERGLAKHPAERPPTADALLAELEAVAVEAYGPGWEERGHRRLARLAGLLLLMFPTPPAEVAEVATTMARTDLTSPTAKLMSKLGAKVAIGAVCTGVLVAVAIVVVSSSDEEPKLQAARSTPTASASSLEVPLPEETTEEPTPEATTPEPTPEPSVSVTAAPPPVAVATKPPTKTPTPKPTPTPKATPTKTKKPTKKPSPSETPDEGITGRSSADETSPPPSSSPPTTSAPPTTQPPTTRPPTTQPPTTQPPTTRPPEGEQPPEKEPTRGDQAGSQAQSAPRAAAQRDAESQEGAGTGSRADAQKDDTTGKDGAALEGVASEGFDGKGVAAVLALGLVTSGAVPVTLAVKRRMSGRHRRRR